MFYKTVGLTDIYFGNAIEELASLPAESVQCVVTSPPYFGLRSYLDKDNPLKEKELGLEQSSQEYVDNLVCLFREIRRVLRKDGTVFLNLGDSFLNKQLQGIPWKVAFALQDDGWVLRQDLIWQKKNPLPESILDRCCKSHEYIFLLSKTKNYFFDSYAIKETSTKHPSDWNPDGTPKRKSHVRGEFIGKGAATKGLEPFRKISETRNRRSVWTTTTQMYKGAHFATMSPKIAELCLLAGTSEKGCCANCGSPYVRKEKVVGTQVTEQMLACGSDKEGNYTGRATKDYEEGKAQNPSDTKRRILESLSKVKEYYFEKSCKCETEEINPCVILDPFGGSGTTAWVANSFKRKAVVIELNEKYLPLIEERIQQPYTQKQKKKVKSPDKTPQQLTLTNLFEEIPE